MSEIAVPNPVGMNGANLRNAKGRLYLVRCLRCRRENYALAVTTGQCCWCGWKDGDPVTETDGETSR